MPSDLATRVDGRFRDPGQSACPFCRSSHVKFLIAFPEDGVVASDCLSCGRRFFERQPSSVKRPSLPSARYALAVTSLLTIYLSFRPFSGWRPPPLSPLAFLSDPLSSITYGWDFAENLLWYSLVGFLVVLAVRPTLSRGAAFLLSVMGPSAFSLFVESVQAYLPSRTSQMADLVANALGAVIGATCATVVAPWLLSNRGIGGLRARWFARGAAGSLGLVVLGAWFITLGAPRTLLYGNGDIRVDLGLRAARLFPADVTIAGEALVTAINLIVLALLVRLITTNISPRRAIFLGLLIGSFAVRTSAFGLFWSMSAAFTWLSPGGAAGLAIGTLISLLLLGTRRSIPAGFSQLLLFVGVVAVNLIPPDPATWMKPRPARQFDLEPVSLLARAAEIAWPLVALAFIVWARCVAHADPERTGDSDV